MDCNEARERLALMIRSKENEVLNLRDYKGPNRYTRIFKAQEIEKDIEALKLALEGMH